MTPSLTDQKTNVIMSYNASDEINDSINYPNLRVFQLASVAADVPQEIVYSRSPYNWEASSPTAVGRDTWEYNYFSGSCYYFARETHKATGLPVGVIASTWGGTIIEAWSSPDALSNCFQDEQVDPTLKEKLIHADMMDQTLEKITILGKADPNDPSALYNGMVNPLIPLVMRGMIWYQGESNTYDPNGYICKQAAMVRDYRLKFENDIFSFYPVQLAPYNSGANYLPPFRLAQAEILNLPYTCVGTAVDLWDPDSPYGEIHPRNKQVVGKRLSLCAQRVDFGLDVDATGPRFTSATTSLFNNEYRTVVSFRSLSNLRLSGIEKCTTCCQTSPFELLVNNNWVSPSRTVPDGININLYTPVANGVPSGIRSMWADIPQCGVYDQAGMIAFPFSSAVSKIGQ